MCIFSRNADVNTTQIFARKRGERQILVYQMMYDSIEENGMILPLPVRENRSESCRFIDLSGYPSFFTDVEQSFAHMTRASKGLRSLEVYTVGDYIASFVPSLHDFHKLSPQFCLDDALWTQLPKQYCSYGFVVCQLQPGKKVIHPFALSFVSSLRELYFPTVHVHDGTVPKRAHFDHMLYFQHKPGILRLWNEEITSVSMDVSLTKKIVHPRLPLSRIRVRGYYENEDICIL